MKFLKPRYFYKLNSLYQTMKILSLFIAILLVNTANSQTLDRNYSDDIYFGADKDNLIDLVIEKVHDYYMNDVNGIIKKLKKEKKININRPENLKEFLSEMKTEIRIKLNEEDNWYDVNGPIYQDYLISVSQLLGNDITIPGLGKANTGNNGNAYVTIVFNDEEVSKLTIRMETYQDYHISNGYPYTNEMLANINKAVKINFGESTREQALWSTSMCSSNEEPVYLEIYKFDGDSDDIAGYIEFRFGPYIQKFDSNNCRYIGNQLEYVYLALEEVY